MTQAELNKEKAKNLTAKLAHQIKELQYENMPEELLERGRQVLIDGIAVAIAGVKQEEPSEILAANAKEYGGFEQSSVLGMGFKTSISQAAMINGGSMHVLDFEPMWNPPNHLMSTCLPAALALVEYKELSGKELLTALIKGVEMSAGVRGASNMHDLNENRFHPPAMIGPLGATVAAAHLLKLDENQIRSAIGIVTSRCGGSWINVGTHTKCLHCGQASFVGLDSAMLASRGYTANLSALEGERGFIDSFLKWEKFDADVLLRYGTEFRILDPGYEIKIYPSNFGTHPGINAALELRSQIKDIDNIVSIREESQYQPYCNRPYPESGLSGKFSHQYTVVRALIDGFVDLDSFTDEKRFEPKVDELLSKYQCNMHEDWECKLNGHRGELVVTLKDGTVLSAVAAAPKGGHVFGSKPVPFEEHYPKLKACLLKGMGDGDANRVIEMGYRIDKLSGEELKEFFRMIRC